MDSHGQEKKSITNQIERKMADVADATPLTLPTVRANETLVHHGNVYIAGDIGLGAKVTVTGGKLQAGGVGANAIIKVSGGCATLKNIGAEAKVSVERGNLVADSVKNGAFLAATGMVSVARDVGAHTEIVAGGLIKVGDLGARCSLLSQNDGIQCQDVGREAKLVAQLEIQAQQIYPLARLTSQFCDVSYTGRVPRSCVIRSRAQITPASVDAKTTAPPGPTPQIAERKAQAISGRFLSGLFEDYSEDDPDPNSSEMLSLFPPRTRLPTSFTDTRLPRLSNVLLRSNPFELLGQLEFEANTVGPGTIRLMRLPSRQSETTPVSRVEASKPNVEIEAALDKKGIKYGNDKHMAYLESQFPDTDGSLYQAFYCPMSRSFMRDPVIFGNSGNTYERSFIAQWQTIKPKLDPLTKVTVSDVTLKTNQSLKNMMLAAIHAMQPLPAELKQQAEEAKAESKPAAAPGIPKAAP